MNRYLLRIVAFLLIPCFITDPALSRMSAGRYIRRTDPNPASFSDQALAACVVASLHSNLLRRIPYFMPWRKEWAGAAVPARPKPHIHLFSWEKWAEQRPEMVFSKTASPAMDTEISRVPASLLKDLETAQRRYKNGNLSRDWSLEMAIHVQAAWFSEDALRPPPYETEIQRANWLTLARMRVGTFLAEREIAWNDLPAEDWCRFTIAFFRGENLEALTDELVSRKKKVDFDLRPVNARLLHPDIVRHNLAVRQTINLLNEPFVGVYGAAGADGSNYLLSTNARTSYFVDNSYKMITVSQWQAALQNPEIYITENLAPYYAASKTIWGHANAGRIETPANVIAAFLFELGALGVDLSQVHVDDDEGQARLNFTWRAPGVSAAEPYKITLIGANMALPWTGKLEKVMKAGIDVYYQRAGETLAASYRDPPKANFMIRVYQSLRPGRYAVTDDYVAVRRPPGEDPDFYDNSAHFPLSSQEMEEIPLRPKLEKTIYQRALQRMLKGRSLKAVMQEGDYPAAHYGWHVRVRRKRQVFWRMRSWAAVLLIGILLSAPGRIGAFDVARVGPPASSSQPPLSNREVQVNLLLNLINASGEDINAYQTFYEWLKHVVENLGRKRPIGPDEVRALVKVVQGLGLDSKGAELADRAIVLLGDAGAVEARPTLEELLEKMEKRASRNMDEQERVVQLKISLSQLGRPISVKDVQGTLEELDHAFHDAEAAFHELTHKAEAAQAIQHRRPPQSRAADGDLPEPIRKEAFFARVAATEMLQVPLEARLQPLSYFVFQISRALKNAQLLTTQLSKADWSQVEKSAQDHQNVYDAFIAQIPPNLVLGKSEQVVKKGRWEIWMTFRGSSESGAVFEQMEIHHGLFGSETRVKIVVVTPEGFHLEVGSSSPRRRSRAEQAAA